MCGSSVELASDVLQLPDETKIPAAIAFECPSLRHHPSSSQRRGNDPPSIDALAGGRLTCRTLGSGIRGVGLHRHVHVALRGRARLRRGRHRRGPRTGFGELGPPRESRPRGAQEVRHEALRVPEQGDLRSGWGLRPPETGADPGATSGELEDAARQCRRFGLNGESGPDPIT